AASEGVSRAVVKATRDNNLRETHTSPTFSICGHRGASLPTCRQFAIVRFGGASYCKVENAAFKAMSDAIALNSQTFWLTSAEEVFRSKIKATLGNTAQQRRSGDAATNSCSD
ncbi:MAG: hypothetical protein U0361_25065, partial [Nitrospiraceae bacterium]